MKHVHHHIHHSSTIDRPAPDEAPRWAIELDRKLSLVLTRLESSMIDTSKILAEVAREKTESASLRTLVSGMAASMTDLSAQLKAAIASGDPAALAQVQADLDKATTDLSTDNDATAAAITANTPAAPPA